MKRPLAFSALVFLVGIVFCFASLLLPSSALADGAAGNDPPNPPPTDTTITVPIAPDEPPNEPLASEEQSVWEEILLLFGL